MKYLLLLLALISWLSAYNYHGCALAPDNLHGWVACLDTALIFHTSDGGVHWQQQNIPANPKKFFDVACFDESRAWTCGILGQILHTDNGGTDWYQQTSGLSKYATRIEFLDVDNGWAACGDGVIGKTTNGGGYWEQVFTPWYAAEFYGVSFISEMDGWLVAGYPDSLLTRQGIILGTMDGGLGWDSLYQVSSYEDFLDVYFFNLFDGVVVGGNDQTKSAIILKTTDGGLNWNSISAPANSYYLRAVDFVDDEGWAVGKHGTIIHTTNKGSTWVKQTNPADTTLFDVDFSDNLHGLACGHNTILCTTNGGQNWFLAGVEENNGLKIEITSLRVWPNPFKNKTFITYSLDHSKTQTSKPDELAIYDISGRLLKNFTPNLSNPTPLVWDGTDNAGELVPPGVYIAKIKSPEQSIMEKVIFLH